MCKIPNRDIAYNDSISTYIFYLLYLDSSQYGRLIALYSAKRKLNLCRTSKFMGQTHIYNLHANFYLNWIIFLSASMCEWMEIAWTIYSKGCTQLYTLRHRMGMKVYNILWKTDLFFIAFTIVLTNAHWNMIRVRYIWFFDLVFLFMIWNLV